MRLVGSHSLAYPISPLKKMTVGMFLASMSFVVAAFVQLEIDVSCPLILQWPFLAQAFRWGVQKSSFSRSEKSRGGQDLC